MTIMKLASFRDDEKAALFTSRKAGLFNVRSIPVGSVAVFSWHEYSHARPNATHSAFVKTIRQACYRAKPMKFRTAIYDDYEPGAVAVERIL